MTKEEFENLKVGDVIFDAEADYTLKVNRLALDKDVLCTVIEGVDNIGYDSWWAFASQPDRYEFSPLYNSPLYLAMSEEDNE